MADFVYNIAKFQLLNGDIDFNLPDDIRILLLEAATDENADDVDVAAVLARAGTTELVTYTRGALASEATSQDDANDRAEFDAADIVFSAVVAQNAVVAYVVFKFITNDASSIPIMFVDSATGLPLTPNGSDITITWNAQGILQLT
jgi:hypothetical protein